MNKLSKMIAIGKAGGETIYLNLRLFLRTRMLITANAGGGKSYFLRLLAEVLFPHVQVIIIDPEGEYYTLREKYGYALIAHMKGSDAVPDVATAALLAHRLLEHKLSAICDLSELKAPVRHTWIRVFLEALMEVPKHLRRRVVIINDEAHLYCMDEKTEILTPTGFKQWNEIKPFDLAVCFDPQTAQYKNEPIKRIITRWHSGEMVHLKSDGIDQLVTPDHRVVLRRIQRGKGRYGLYDWTFCNADSVPHHIHIPCGGAKEGTGIPDLSISMAKLLGWVITDGCFAGSGKDSKYERYIAISQARITRKCGRSMHASLVNLLGSFGVVSAYDRAPRKTVCKKTGTIFNHRRSSDFYLGKALSSELLRWLGHELHRVPREIIQGASKAQLRAIYEGLLEGDGTSNKGGWCAFYPGHSEGLADDFQEIALRLGISVVKKQVPQTGQWTVLISKRKHHHIRKPTIQKYTGIVWDVTVPSGAFVARREGKVFVTGNCPEKGQGESEAHSAMLDIATRGRKRGYTAVFASQRHAKVSKSATAELLNRMVGPTFEGADIDRAIADLSIAKDERHGFAEQLKVLEEGNFNCIGRAISKKRVLFKVNTVKTTHPDPDDLDREQVTEPPLPPQKVRALLAKLADLPQEAEKKAKTEAELKKEISELRRRAGAAEAALALEKRKAPVLVPVAAKSPPAAAPKAPPRIEVKKVDVPVVAPGDVKRLERALDRAEKLYETMKVFGKPVDEAAKELRAAIGAVLAVDSELILEAKSRKLMERQGRPVRPLPPAPPAHRHAATSRLPVPAAPKPLPRTQSLTQEDFAAETDPLNGPLSSRQNSILTSLLQFESIGIGEVPREWLTGWMGIKVTGTFKNNLGGLRTRGYVDYVENKVKLTDAGRAVAIPSDEEISTEGLLKHCLEAVNGRQQEILKYLHSRHPDWVTREELVEAMGIKITGTFKNNLGGVHSAGMVEYGTGEYKGSVKCSDWMFVNAMA